MRTMTSCGNGDDPTRARNAASIVGRSTAPRAGFPGNAHPRTRATTTMILRYHCSRFVIVFLLRRRRAACSTRTEADVLGIQPNRPEVNEGTTWFLAVPVRTSILLFSASAENNSSSCSTYGASHGVQPAGYGGKRPCLPLWKGETMKRAMSRLLVRRILAVVLMFAFLSMVSAPPARAATLSDIAGRPDQAVIERVVAKGFMTGYPNGTFRPNAPVTRAEFVVALARSAGLDPVQSPAKTLKDLPTSNWAAPLVYAAIAKGWVSGYPD